jgi:hypothetical protein
MAFAVSIGPPVDHRNRTALIPTPFSKSLHESRDPLTIERSIGRPIYPIAGIFAALCARTGSEHTATEPAIPLMKSRRRIAAPSLRPRHNPRFQQKIVTEGTGSMVSLRNNDPWKRMSP